MRILITRLFFKASVSLPAGGGDDGGGDSGPPNALTINGVALTIDGVSITITG